MSNKELADWITEHLDSHMIVDESLLYELPTAIRARIPVYTQKQQAAAIKARGLGGWINEDAPPTANGWEIAEAIAKERLGYNPGDTYHGRGARFRACITALRNTETVTAT